MSTWPSSAVDAFVGRSPAPAWVRHLLLCAAAFTASPALADDSPDTEQSLNEATADQAADSESFTIEEELDSNLDLGGEVPPGPASEGGLELTAPSTAPEYVPAESEGSGESRKGVVFEIGAAITFEQQFIRANAPIGQTLNQEYNFTGVGYHMRGYLGRRRFGFLFDGAFLMPLRGSQLGPQGQDVRIRDTYDQVLGGDVLGAFAYRRRLGELWTMRVGGGPHLSAFRFNDDELEPFEHVALGMGATADFVYDINKIFHIGGQTTVAVDFWDLIHGDDRPSIGKDGQLRYMVAWNIGFLAGVRFQ